MAADRPDVSRVWASNSPQNIINPDTRIPNKIVTGWEAEVPPFEFFNWYQNNTDLFKLALAERGICQWGSDVTYRKGALTFFDGDGRIYIAQKLNKGQQPQIGEYWQRSAIQITEADLQALERKIDNHIDSKTNPHDIHAHQIGSYTKQEIDGLFKGGTDNLDKHEKDFSNPHRVTAQQAGGVPVTGGTYTGQINTTANEMIIGKGHTGDKSSVVAVHDHVALTRGNRELGLDTTQPYYFDGTTKFRLVPEQIFAILKLFNEPKYAVPRPDFWMPLSSDINIYEGDGMVTFERASTATYVNKQGELAIAEANEPRFEKDGILIEGTSTNITSNSTISRFSGGEDIYSVENLPRTDVFPQVTRLTIKPNSKFGFPETNFSIGTPWEIQSGKDFSRTISVWVFIEELAEGIISLYETGSEGIPKNIVIDQNTPKNMWVRLQVHNSGTHTHTGDNRTYGYTPTAFTSGAKILFAGLQVENLPFATSYIPTNGTPVTRVKDLLVVEAPSAFVKDKLSICIDVNPIGLYETVNYYSDVMSVFGLQYNIFRIEQIGKYSSFISDSALALGTPSGGLIGNTARLAKTFDRPTTTHKGYLDGKLVGTKTADNYRVDGDITSIVLGDLRFNGHIKSFRVWDGVLTPEQISTL